jgi:YQGE family putative transporter
LGYTFIFVLSFLWSVYTTYLTTRLKNDKIAGRSNLPGVYRYIFTHKEALAVNLAELVRGIRNMSFPLFLSIIFFKFMTSEAALGVNSMLCGLASIIAYILAGRLIRPKSRLKYILTYSIISIVVFLPLFFVMNAAALFLLAIVNAFITAFIDNPALGFIYTVFEKPVEGITFSQIMSAHEIFLATGRWIGYILLIVFSKSFLMLAIYALIANLSTVIVWAVLRIFVSPTKKNSVTNDM